MKPFKILVTFALLAASLTIADTAGAQSTEDAPAGASTLVNSALRELVDAAADGDARGQGGDVVVEVHYNTTAADARALVEAAGGTVNGEVEGWLVQALVPLAGLEALEADPAIDFLSLPGASDPIFLPPAPEPGPGQAVNGAQVVESNADDWHAAGWDGSGVKVGIIDTFNQPDWTSAQASGDLPAVSGTFCRYQGAACNIWGGGDHGNNVAEIIHDMAPGADLYIAYVFTAADIQAAVDYFDTQGVDIISQSQTNRYDGPGDGTGPFGSIVDDAVSKGMVWLNAAGNNSGTTGNGSYWRGTFLDSDGDGWVEFNGSGDETLQFYGRFQNGVRWSDWGEVGATDYNVYVYSADAGGGTLLGSSTNNQTAGADPLELVTSINYNSTANFLSIYMANAGAGAAGDIIEFMQNGGGIDMSSNPYNAGGPFSDSANPGSMSIGAIDPATGNTIAGYSSWGPTNDARTKPDMSAQSCVVTSISGCFNGTSAATPVVAGAAALVLESGRASTPAEVVSYLRNEATVDRGAAGVDNIYGWGELLLPAPCTEDGYEENDTRATATPLANGTAVSASVCGPDEDDWFSLRVAAGVDISVDVTFSDALGDLDVRLFDPSGTEVDSSASTTDNESITHTALTSGVYAARVYGYNDSENAYQVEMSRSICPPDDAFEPNNSGSPTPLTSGVTVSAIACDAPGATTYNNDWYSLAVQAGDTITALAEFEHEGGNLSIALYNPAGTIQVANSVSNTDNESVSHLATEDGAYKLLVWGSEGHENIYDLTMTATSCPPDDAYENNDTRLTATALGNGDSIDAIACPSDDDWYSLPVTAGLDVTVDLTFTHAFGDVDVRLFNPAGTQVASGVSSTDNESITHTALASGLYTARVYGHAGAQNVYELTMAKSICPPDDPYENNDTQATATVMTDGVTLSATVCDTDWYEIPTVAGQTVSADVEFVHAGGDISIALYNPSGTVQVANSVSSTDNESVTYVATETGDYGLFVWGAGGAENVYDVTMSSLCTDDAFEDNDTRLTATPLSNGVPVAAHVCANDDDWFSIPATAGQLVTVEALFAHAGGDLDIELHRPDGGLVATAESEDDNEAITWTAAQTGTYSVHVYGYNSAANDYTVSMKAGAHPRLRPFGAVVTEGDTGSQIAQALVYLVDAAGDPYVSPTPITVNYATTDIPTNPVIAHPYSDFQPGSGQITFQPGETTGYVPIEVLGDTEDEPPALYGEWALFTLNTPSSNAKIDNAYFFGLGLVIILDDD